MLIIDALVMILCDRKGSFDQDNKRGWDKGNYYRNICSYYNNKRWLLGNFFENLLRRLSTVFKLYVHDCRIENEEKIRINHKYKWH